MHRVDEAVGQGAPIFRRITEILISPAFGVRRQTRRITAVEPETVPAGIIDAHTVKAFPLCQIEHF